MKNNFSQKRKCLVATKEDGEEWMKLFEVNFNVLVCLLVRQTNIEI